METELKEPPRYYSNAVRGVNGVWWVRYADVQWVERAQRLILPVSFAVGVFMGGCIVYGMLAS